MISYRVIVYGVWPSLKPSGNARHYFDTCHENEDEARAFFDACDMPSMLYSIDFQIPEISRRVLAEKK
jgi:hypothetical protein